MYLRDDKSGEFWTATPSPAAGAIKHVTKFGQGYATYTHRHRGLDVELTAFVPEHDPDQDSAAANPQRRRLRHAS